MPATTGIYRYARSDQGNKYTRLQYKYYATEQLTVQYKVGIKSLKGMDDHTCECFTLIHKCI